MRLHSLQVHLPAEMLAIDLAHVGDEEGFLFACLASIGVDAADAIFQGILDDCPLVVVFAIEIAMIMDILRLIILQNNR